MDKKREAKDMLSYKLRRIIEERNIDQKDIARVAGVTEGAVSQWISGKTIPKIGRLQRVADFLGVPLSYFVDSIDMTIVAYNGSDPLKQEISNMLTQILNKTDDATQLKLLKNLLEGFLKD